MGDHEQRLLAAVVLRCIDLRYVLTIQVGHVLVTDANDEPVAWCAGGNFTRAIASIAEDIGVEAPEPSRA